MFDFFRNNIKLLMGFLMLLIIPSFVLFGIEGYSGFREQADVVARVGKLEITRQEWDAAHRNEVDRSVANMPGIDRSLFETPAARRATLERLVNERVLALAAADAHFVTSDAQLARYLMQDPSIAALRGPDGKLDTERYRQILQGQGMSPEMFEASVRADLARRQVGQGVEASSFLTQTVARQALNAYFEQREVQWALFKPADFRSRVQVTDADVQQYYDQNPQRFQTAEQVDVEYLVLDLDAVAAKISLSEADLRAYHEQNNANLAQQERRRASHILLTVDASAAPADKARVREQAEALLAELRQAPNRFAELARTRSQDPGSASQGGDLDFFQRNDMVKPFSDAVYALDKGAISEVVETEFGFHIIRLTDIRAVAPEPFDAARPRLEAELKRQQAQRQFAEAAEDFSNLVYEQSDTLAPAANKLGLVVRQVRNVQRTGPADAAAHPALSSPRLLSALFAPDALSQKRNTEALEVGPNQLVSARVLAHRPAATRPLAEVSPMVREQLLLQLSQNAARAEGEARLQAWQASPDAAALRPPVVVSRVAPQGLPEAALAVALRASAGPTQAAWASADLGAEGYAVLRINRVLPRAEPDATRARQEREQLGEIWAKAEAQAYLEALRARYKAQVVDKKLSTEP